MATSEQAGTEAGADAFGMGTLAWIAGHRAAPLDRAPAHRAAAAEVTRHWTKAPAVRGERDEPAPHNLRPREREVLLLLCDGLQKVEILAALGIAMHTLNQYLQTLHAAFGTHTMHGLVGQALRTGAIPL